MKRFLALILALTMALALAACGGGNEPAAESPDGGTETTASGRTQAASTETEHLHVAAVQSPTRCLD